MDLQTFVQGNVATAKSLSQQWLVSCFLSWVVDVVVIAPIVLSIKLFLMAVYARYEIEHETPEEEPDSASSLVKLTEITFPDAGFELPQQVDQFVAYLAKQFSSWSLFSIRVM
jgi:hypothetical protein